VVVVEQDQAGRFGGGDDEVGNGNAMTACTGQLGLDVDGSPEDGLGDWDGVVGEGLALPDALVLLVIADFKSARLWT
jgi:hypothetical protein